MRYEIIVGADLVFLIRGKREGLERFCRISIVWIRGGHCARLSRTQNKKKKYRSFVFLIRHG